MTMRECLEDHKKRVDKGKKNVDKKQKILIVDDAKFNRDILKEILGDNEKKPVYC